MARIIKNKHYTIASAITADKFDETYGLSELIISNQKGSEGIYVMNDEKEVIKINANNDFKQVFVTIEEYEKLITDGEIEINGQKVVYDENAYYAVYEPTDNQ